MDLARVSSGGCRPEEDAATAHTTAFFLSREVRRELAGDRGGTCRERGARLERGAVGRGACREIGLDLASAPNRERGPSGEGAAGGQGVVGRTSEVAADGFRGGGAGVVPA